MKDAVAAKRMGDLGAVTVVRAKGLQVARKAEAADDESLLPAQVCVARDFRRRGELVEQVRVHMSRQLCACVLCFVAD